MHQAHSPICGKTFPCWQCLSTFGSVVFPCVEERFPLFRALLLQCVRVVLPVFILPFVSGGFGIIYFVLGTSLDVLGCHSLCGVFPSGLSHLWLGFPFCVGFPFAFVVGVPPSSCWDVFSFGSDMCRFLVCVGISTLFVVGRLVFPFLWWVPLLLLFQTSTLWSCISITIPVFGFHVFCFRLELSFCFGRCSPLLWKCCHLVVCEKEEVGGLVVLESVSGDCSAKQPNESPGCGAQGLVLFGG